MKLKNRNPANFVGRIIIHRHQSWKIQSVIGDTIYLCRDYLDHKGANRENGKNRALSPATDPRVSRQRVIFLDDFQVQRLGNGLIRSFGVCRHRRPVRFKSQPR